MNTLIRDIDEKKFCCTDKMNMYEMCVTCYNAFFSDPDFQIEMYEHIESEPRVSSPATVCECGGESTGDNLHSHWCPKWQK